MYKLTFQNSIGMQNITVNLIPEGPPITPTIVSVNNVHQTSALLTWTRGFHGGFGQTIYVEISVDSQRWNVKLELYEGKNENKREVNTTLEQLQPGILYYIRMYAENERGISQRTRIVNVTLLNNGENVPPNRLPLIVGGSIGGLTAGAIVLLAAVLVIKRWRCKYLGRQDDINKLTSGHNLHSISRTKSDSDDEDDEVINPIYDGQDNIDSNAQSADNLYSQPNKPKHSRPAAGPSSDIYAVVNKKKKDNQKVKREKGPKAKKGTTGDQDVYENAQPSALKDVNHANSSNMKNVNQDGLLYADLVFANPPKGQKRLVIHGIDDMTEYAEVDLTKRAEPLPESDDENDSNKK